MLSASRLDPQHFAEFKQSAIPKDLIHRAGIHRVSASEAHEITGHSCGPGWAVPFTPPVEGYIVEQVKPDKPYVFSNGREAKYLWPKGEPNRLYFPPGADAVLQVVGAPILITEGVKKVLAAVGAGFHAIGLIGVWNWVKDGHAISDFDLVKWQGRTVLIAFDSDTQINRDVLRAQRRLAFELERRGSIVKIVSIPHAAERSKVGLDDGLAKHGKSWLEALVKSATDLLPFELNRLRSLPASVRDGEIERLLGDCAACLTPVRMDRIIGALSEEFEISRKALYVQSRRNEWALDEAQTERIEANPDSLNQIRRNNRIPAIQARQDVCRIILLDLLERGKLLNSDRGVYFVNTKSGQVLDVHEPEFLALCNKWYGSNSAEQEWKHFISNLDSHAITNAQKVVVRELAYFDKNSCVLYVDKGAGKVWVLDGTEIKETANGTRGIFLRTPGYKPVTPLATTTVSWDTAIFKLLDIDTSTGLAAAQARLLLKVWIWAMFFPELLPTRPILTIVGARGSAKTSFLRASGRVIFGPDFEVKTVSERQSDLETAIVSSRFLVLDNVDQSGPAGLMDLLAVCATGGEITRRKLYTTATEMRYRISCFMALTSRTPQFQRDDIAERLLVISASRLPRFKPENQLMDAVQGCRRRLWWLLLRELNRIVSQLKEWDNDDTITDYRLSDFANFGLRAVLPECRDEWRAALQSLHVAQNAFLLGRDRVAKALKAWLQDKPAEGKREWKATQIVVSASINSLTAEQLGRRLKNSSDPLHTWIQVTHRNLNGSTLYRLRLKPTPS